MQRESSITPLAPSSYVTHSSIKSLILDTVLAEQKITFQTPEEFIYYMTHKVNNKIHTNGRIYMSIDNSGNLFANSVSPYSDKFFDNIEPKIKPLVQAFHHKRYLTYSSCEGHGNSFRRYVGLAFVDEESREYVYNYISKLKIKGVTLKKQNTVINQHIQATNTTKTPIYVDKFEANNNYEDEAKTFNIQFHRNYERYYFLEIIILEAIPVGQFWKNPIKNSWLLYMKKYFWDKQTKKVTQAIESSSFKKYYY